MSRSGEPREANADGYSGTNLGPKKKDKRQTDSLDVAIYEEKNPNSFSNSINAEVLKLQATAWSILTLSQREYEVYYL